MLNIKRKTIIVSLIALLSFNISACKSENDSGLSDIVGLTILGILLLGTYEMQYSYPISDEFREHQIDKLIDKDVGYIISKKGIEEE